MPSKPIVKSRRTMNRFGKGSRKQLATVDGRLQALAHRVLQIKDHSVIRGHRNKEDQDAAFNAVPKRSKLKWPNGKHNKLPSIAVDVQTYPFPKKVKDVREEQLYLLGIYKGIAQEQGIPVRTGADWDRDGEIADNSFDDFFHVEIDE